jgi:hypothetical protein
VVLETMLTAAVLGFVGWRLVTGANVAIRGAGRREVRLIVRGIRWRHLWPVPFVLAAVLAAAAVLLLVPLLDWGWWRALGGLGNPVTGSTEQTAGTMWEWLIPLIFVALLIPALPLFAITEERIFRLGAEGWSWPRRVAKAVQFGLVHMLIGIPIAVALALSVGGGYFQWAYLRGYRATGDRQHAILESTRAHTVYNATIVSVVALAAVTIALT